MYITRSCISLFERPLLSVCRSVGLWTGELQISYNSIGCFVARSGLEYGLSPVVIRKQLTGTNLLNNGSSAGCYHHTQATNPRVVLNTVFIGFIGSSMHLHALSLSYSIPSLELSTLCVCVCIYKEIKKKSL